MKRHDKVVYLLLLVIFLALSAVTVYVMFVAGKGEVRLLEIVSDGEVVRGILLQEMYGDIVIELGEPGHANTVVVGPGGAKMVASDCSGGDCLRMPEIDAVGELIVCLPHKLIVRIVGSGGARVPQKLDGVSY